MDNFVITIARGYGSSGKEIGTELAKRLQIHCYDSEILSRASNKSGISQEKFEEYDEKTKRKFLKNTIYNWAMGISDKDNSETIDGYRLFQLQSEVIREIAKAESCVIIGKCADYILQDSPNVVSIYIDAPRWACLKKIIQTHGWSADQANSMLVKTEKQRSEYYRCYTGGQEWTNPMNYDITLNSARLGKEGCIATILECLNYKMKLLKE